MLAGPATKQARVAASHIARPERAKLYAGSVGTGGSSGGMGIEFAVDLQNMGSDDAVSSGKDITVPEIKKRRNTSTERLLERGDFFNACNIPRFVLYDFQNVN